MQGYKVFEPDWTCRGFQYEVGETYEEDVTPSCCNRGFHFCTELRECFNYYPFNPDNKVAEIEALGEIDAKAEGSKCCTNKIKIVREISWKEVLKMVNTGKNNSANCNSGNRNSGNYNSGNHNSGNYNSGNYNSGYWNKTNYSTGCFNTKESKIFMFNKPSNWTLNDWMCSDARYVLSKMNHSGLEWVRQDNMTDEEKEQFSEYKTIGGYLKKLDKTECSQIWWNSLSADEKKVIKSLPNFDSDIFEQITGIHIK